MAATKQNVVSMVAQWGEKLFRASFLWSFADVWW